MTITWRQVEKEMMEDPEVRRAWEELAPSYQVARLRILRGWTQKELAERVGTKQPSIARLESGGYSPSLAFLRRVVEALGGKLTITIEPAEEPAAITTPAPWESEVACK